jgi:hypothetical protein
MAGRALLSVFAMVLGAAALATVPAEARPARAGGVVYEGSCDAAPPPGTTRLWMGHFTGGTYGARQTNPLKMPQRQVLWADEYRCFSSQARCYAWQRSLHRAYGRIQSNWTCLPIR